VIFSSGSPFPPVVINGKRFTTGQANNCLAFPGIALGALSMRARYLPDEIYLTVAHVLANYTSEESLMNGNLYPLISEMNELSFAVAVSVALFLDKNGESLLNCLANESKERLLLYRSVQLTSKAEGCMQVLAQLFIQVEVWTVATKNLGISTIYILSFKSVRCHNQVQIMR